jgi:hypothetical protein
MAIILSKLNNIMKSTKGLRVIHQWGKVVYFGCYKNSLFWVKALLRCVGLGGAEYNKLKEFQNGHNGRCFIIATGPSLTINDLKKLKNEITFGMNSLCKVFDTLGWETTYFGIQDFSTYKKLKEDIAKLKSTIVFYGSEQFKTHPKGRFRMFRYPQYMLNHVYTYDKLMARFSRDSFKVVYDGYSITYSLIQIAVYMGFKEIYLLGCDNNYSDNKKKQHFIESGHYDPTYKTAGDRMTVGYLVAKKYADTHGIKIFNATRGGMLEVFPRVDLDEILGIKGK